MKRKYPETTGYYVYEHRLPNGLYYPGMSSQQPCYRWKPSKYKGKSLYPYIEQFGWDNIEHVIVADGLTKEEAEQLENQLIQEGKKNGLCINKNNSGGYCRDNPTEYYREYNQRPEVKERQREYCRNRYQNNQEYRERQLEYQREYRKRPENKEKQREYLRQYRLKKKSTQ